MATAKSDDENEDHPHPLAKERPGVYVQVVSPRRRKGRASIPDETAPGDVRVTAVAEVISPLAAQLTAAIDAQPRASSVPPTAADDAAPDAERASGERPVDRASVVSAVPAPVRPRFASENGAAGGDLVFVSLPPPPRVPSFDGPGLSRYRDEPEDGPSVLDAPVSLRAEAAPAKASWPLFAFIAALSAIIASAGVVAWREAPRGSGESAGAPVSFAPAEPAPSARVPSEAPAAERAPSAAESAPQAGDVPADGSSDRAGSAGAGAPPGAPLAAVKSPVAPAVRTALVAVSKPAAAAAPGSALRPSLVPKQPSIAPPASAAPARTVAPAEASVAPSQPNNVVPALPIVEAPASPAAPAEPVVNERPITPPASQAPADLPQNPYDEPSSSP